MILRSILFSVLIFMAVAAPTWVLALCAFAYALRYTAYELLVLAAAIDAYYGLGEYAVPYYLFTAIAVLFFLEWIKPRISVYNEAK